MSNTVSDSEEVARFILNSRSLKQDKTFRINRPNEFMPHPHADLSVTRKYNLSKSALSELAKSVAAQRQKTLIGWANIKVAHVSQQHLKTVADPLPNNPHHANITGWPVEKCLQKSIALELAAQATYEEPTE